jgi:hypothetical protein
MAPKFNIILDTPTDFMHTNKVDTQDNLMSMLTGDATGPKRPKPIAETNTTQEPNRAKKRKRTNERRANTWTREMQVLPCTHPLRILTKTYIH